MIDDRTSLVSGVIEVGNWVVVTGQRYNGRKGKVLRINGSVATVRGPWGGWANKGRSEREFFLDHLSLYTEDMDESTGEYH